MDVCGAVGEGCGETEDDAGNEVEGKLEGVSRAVSFGMQMPCIVCLLSAYAMVPA